MQQTIPQIKNVKIYKPARAHFRSEFFSKMPTQKYNKERKKAERDIELESFNSCGEGGNSDNWRAPARLGGKWTYTGTKTHGRTLKSASKYRKLWKREQEKKRFIGSIYGLG